MLLFSTVLPGNAGLDVSWQVSCSSEHDPAAQHLVHWCDEGCKRHDYCMRNISSAPCNIVTSNFSIMNFFKVFFGTLPVLTTLFLYFLLVATRIIAHSGWLMEWFSIRNPTAFGLDCLTKKKEKRKTAPCHHDPHQCRCLPPCKTSFFSLCILLLIFLQSATADNQITQQRYTVTAKVNKKG